MTVQERSEGYQKWIADSDIFDIDICQIYYFAYCVCPLVQNCIIKDYNHTIIVL